MFFIGTSGWSYSHWKGSFYPGELPQNKWFDFYARTFATVEVNATFYRSFKEQTYHNWYAKAPEGFIYVLKAPRIITHQKYLKDVEKDVNKFWTSSALLKEKLGLILLQLAPGTQYNPELLKKALLAFENPNKVAVEFRHKRWITNDIKDMLSDLGVTFCNVDSPQSKLTDWLTSDTAYLRLHGRRQWYADYYSDEELLEIVSFIKNSFILEAKTVFVFFNNDLDGNAAENARTLKRYLEQG